jgi:hypothetical protein
VFVGFKNELPFPEPEGTMILESGHAAKDSVMQEEGETPFHSFLRFGTRFMNDLSEVTQYWPGKPG